MFEVEDDYTRDWVGDELPEDLQDVIHRMTRTCDACPTQYDIVLVDYRSAYFRLRHGNWRIDVDGVTVAYDAHRTADGYLSHADVLDLLRANRDALTPTFQDDTDD